MLVCDLFDMLNFLGWYLIYFDWCLSSLEHSCIFKPRSLFFRSSWWDYIYRQRLFSSALKGSLLRALLFGLLVIHFLNHFVKSATIINVFAFVLVNVQTWVFSFLCYDIYWINLLLRLLLNLYDGWLLSFVSRYTFTAFFLALLQNRVIF